MKKSSIDQDILYADNHILVVNKQPSDIVQGDKTGDEPLSEILKRYLKERFNKPGNVFLGVVHRLDRPVSGVLVFARTSKALTRINAMLKAGELHKTYWAVVKNRPTKTEDHLIGYLRRDEAKNKTFVSGEPGKNRQKAELKYRVAGISDTYFLLEINLLTGRHHQIRAQLSDIGCPIKGDLKYGFPRSNADGSIHLHARSVRFIHPVSKQEIYITANPPDDPVWNYFLNQQANLKSITP
jgi:23S rRNA pseudouridine1911/1915/1917 synthase